MKRVLSLLCVMVLFVAMMPMASAAVANATHYKAYVATGNKGQLIVRKTPHAPANNVVIKLDYGTEVTVTSHADDTWCTILVKVKGKEYSGYTKRQYLSTTKPQDIPKPTKAPDVVEETLNYGSFKLVEPYEVRVRGPHAGSTVNLRWAPSTSVRVIEKVLDGSYLTVICEGKGWYQVKDEATGYVGFMKSSFLMK